MKLFFDVDTQIDFLFPAGALYAPGAEKVIGPVSRLIRYAAEQNIPVISSMCAHPEDSREFATWPPHCVIDTVGQLKPASTLLEERVTVPNRRSDRDISGAKQILVEKDDLDVFSNPNLPALLNRIGADEFFVYGVFTEYCVQCAITGLLKHGGRVFLVEDAIAAVDAATARRTIEQFQTAGGRVIRMYEAASALQPPEPYRKAFISRR